MRIGVPLETEAFERRVALGPEVAGRLAKAGHAVCVERGAGLAAGFVDAQYEAAGARIAPDPAEVLGGAELVLKVRCPTQAEVERFAEGAVLVSFLGPAANAGILRALVDRKVTALGMELVPRISRAQAMDALSSQWNLAGYKAVIIGTEALNRVLPMMTTAAGTLPPAKVFVLGAGVAGLQAIATARRLGAIVSAFDVRPAAKEQVHSLGASFLDARVAAEGAGGYAKELPEEEGRRVLETVGKHIANQDMVIATAQVPGRPAPRLVTGQMVRSMKRGSVIVDLAAEAGGNCELTKPGEVVEVEGVVVLGPVNVPSTLAFHASQTYSRNLMALLEHILDAEGRLKLDLSDPIMGAMVVTHAGQVRGI
ncbi:MAG TPA: Re/Si-specific NAD(P)(+) transhydrogenase subunit alpha [Anaeromyxobacteraceae bacterium]|nr:Re/Si-specific NAD(P)(+) transhydrogenase subunit alpha [Anaeromyxobacteraceae bacterium]